MRRDVAHVGADADDHRDPVGCANWMQRWYSRTVCVMPSSSASADQRVTDRHLEHAGHGAQEIGEVGAIQVVPGIDAQAHRLRRTCGRGIARQHGGLPGRAVSAGVGLGVQLDAIGAELGGMRHRLRQRIHEKAHAHAQGTRLGHQRPQPLHVGGQVPAVVGGELLRPYQAPACIGAAFNSRTNCHQVVGRVALDVVLDVRPLAQQRSELVHVARADVALVGPRVHGDALRAGQHGDARQRHHVGHLERARIAQQRDLVDVDRQRGARIARKGFGSDQRIHRGGVVASSRRCVSMANWRVRSIAPPR